MNHPPRFPWNHFPPVCHGGTLANLRGHILAQKGYVIGATVLAGKDYSAQGMPNRTLTEWELRQSRINNWRLDKYYTRILRTPPKLE
nr:hypothetical protein [uncultured Duganella sp.]